MRDAAEEAHQGEQVGRDPSWTQADDRVPERVEHVVAQRGRVHARVLREQVTLCCQESGAVNSMGKAM